MTVLPLPIRMPLISFVCLIAVARTSNNMWNNWAASGHPCLVLDFSGEAFSFSLLSIIFAVGLSQMAFILLRNVPSAPTLVSFYHKWMLDLFKCFFCICWDNHVFFYFSFVNVVYYVGLFAYVEWSMWSWDESHLIDPFYMLLRIFASIFNKDIVMKMSIKSNISIVSFTISLPYWFSV